MSLFGCDHGPLIAQLRADLAAADAREVRRVAEMDALRGQADDLLSRLLAMKASGYVLPEVPNVSAQHIRADDWPAPAAEPDELAALIDVQCGRDYRKRAMMLAQLKTDRAGGVDPEAIRAAIVNGVQSGGVPA